MSDQEPQSGAEVLKRIRPRLREVSTDICLRPDLLDEWEALDQKLAEIQDRKSTAAAKPGRMTDKGDPALDAEERATAERIAEVEDEIEETKLHVTLRAMPNPAWEALTERHPPRRGNSTDQMLGYNVPEVEAAAIREGMIDPVFQDCDEGPECEHIECGSWQQLERLLNPSEWTELRRCVRLANERVSRAPKSARAARVLSTHAADSPQDEPGASARSGSTDGSRKRSTKASTKRATASP